jgi:hypothetical protein
MFVNLELTKELFSDTVIKIQKKPCFILITYCNINQSGRHRLPRPINRTWGDNQIWALYTFTYALFQS